MGSDQHFACVKRNADLTPFFRIVLPFLAGYYLSYVYRAVNAVLGPTLAREFHLSATELGFLTGVYFFSFGLFQIPLGLLLDRFGPRRVNGTLLVLAAAGSLGFALSRRRGKRASAGFPGDAEKLGQSHSGGKMETRP